MGLSSLLSHTPTVIALIGVAVTACSYTVSRFLHARRACRDLPQPPHSFWFGHLIVAGKIFRCYPTDAYFHHLLITLSREYDLPDLFYLDLWPMANPMVVLCAPELAAQITTEQVYPKDPAVGHFLSPFLGKSSILSVSGPEWKALHSIFVPAFAPAYIRTMVDGFLDEVLIYHDNLCQLAKSEQPFSMASVAIELTFNVIGRAVFNSPFHNEEGRRLMKNFKSGLDYAFNGALSTRNWLVHMVPKWILVWKVNRYIEKKVISRFAELKREESSSVKKSRSILDLLLRQKLDSPKGVSGDSEFMEVAVSNIKTFLAAGHETTAHTLGYVFMLLSKHPEIVRKAREEHDTLFSPDFNRTVEMIRENPEKLYDLQYTTAIIKETLRLFPVASVARAKGEGMTFMYKGKALNLTDQLLMICHLAMHYNEELFPSPCEFQPERFITQTIPKDAWRAFERGARNCIGQDLAMMEMRMVLLIALRSFEFEALGINPHDNPAASYTTLDREFGDLVYQMQSLTARPIGGQHMKVRFAKGHEAFPIDLLDSTSEKYSDRYDQERDVFGLDIGTGASCIYPLLGCALRPKWKFAATDIDAKNLKYARDNVRRNKLDSRIQIVESAPANALIPLGEIGLPESLDFIMCNPPFYESRDELISAAKAKQRPPFSACTGAEVEMITAGGEVAFVTRMIRESVKLRDRVQWYTSMVGKFSSVATLLNILHEEGNKNWAVAEFVQGSKTRRWAIGWSWMDYRPGADAARPRGQSIPKHLLPFPPEFTFHCPPCTPLSTTIDAVNSSIAALDVYWCWDSGTCTGLGFARGNAWSRHARRQMKKQAIEKAQTTAGSSAHAEHGEKDSKDNDAKPADFIPGKQDKGAEFGFKVSVRGGMEGQVEVTVRWVKGSDAVIFESFCGFLKRKVERGA
ncbi:hypothetical protein EMPG_11008 [Blastomyces silverae]|uniref:Uncharacterized protein n=1 Tax=Blastomyces silverae TaxID=2060906 RepID=A0A0H1B348_9EURO|nr:hypothetical protein EMPG_11008 [Blastomyces silverae]